MNFHLWKKTLKIKPFESITEWEEFEKDCCKLPSLEPFINSPLKKSKIKKGISAGDRYDSFAEFTMKTYYTKIMGYIVERNYSIKLPYTDSLGKLRNYIPDFSINGKFFETKGRITELDLLKQAAHPEVTFVFQEEINKMAKELDKQFPGWREDFIRTN